MNQDTTIRGTNRILLAGLVGLTILVLTGCGVFSDDPTRQALQHIRRLIDMPEPEYQQKRKNIALREKASIDYMRAMRVQNTSLSYEVVDIRRPRAKQRVVKISVSEKRVAGVSHERARFRIRVEQNTDGIWNVVSFQLIE
ncbi:MAG: hypothetical protein ACC641_03550 [Acidiferrobacterales bacterium]